MTVDPLTRVVDRLRELGCDPQGANGTWTARCPAHDDHDPSLSVSRGDKRPVVVYCHAGCTLDAIRTALGWTRPTKGKGKRRAGAHPGEYAAVYTYADELGAPLFHVGRSADKRFVQWPEGGKPAKGAMDGLRRVPYRLPELVRHRSEGRGPVFVVEGEKDVDRLRALGEARHKLTATTLPGGAKGALKWVCTLAEHVEGAHVVVLPDGDEPGRTFASAVAAAVWRAAASVKVVDLHPERDDGADVSDWLDANPTGRGPAALLLAVEDSAEWEPPDCPLDELVAFLGRYVVFADGHQPVAVALWILHTHAFVAAETAPRLWVNSPQKESGKTRLFEVLEQLVRHPMSTVNTSVAALFRKVEQTQSTVLFDEVDNVLKGADPDKRDLLGLLNAGYRYGGVVTRCVGEGAGTDVKDFPVFAPLALAGVGALPDTLASRCVRIALKRRKKTEPVERWRLRDVRDEAAALRARCAEWAQAHLDELEQSLPTLPDELGDRAQDLWEPLCAVADVAGGDWPRRARAAAVALTAAVFDDDESEAAAMLLLRDIRTVFAGAGTDRLWSDVVARRLNALEESPWGGMRKGEGLDARGLAKRLRPYGVRPKQVRIGDVGGKSGYLRESFVDVWDRYLPSTTNSDGEGVHEGDVDPSGVTQPLHLYTAGQSTFFTNDDVSADEPKTASDQACRGVEDREPPQGLHDESDTDDGDAAYTCVECGGPLGGVPADELAAGRDLCRACFGDLDDLPF